MQLRDKVAVVTGGTGGIGSAVAARFAREGAQVILSGRNAAKGEKIAEDIRAKGGFAHFVASDVTDEASVQDLVARAVTLAGRLHVIVNNAGPVDLLRAGVDRSLHLMKTEDFDAVLRSGLHSAMWCCKYGIPEMTLAGGGSIVNISSLAAVQGFPSLPAYSAAKGALCALTRQLAVDYAGANIRVNAIVVGLVVHDGSKNIVSSRERADDYLSRQLSSRFGEPADIAAAAAYLASDDAKFVTGSSLTVDGGTSAMSRRGSVALAGRSPYAVSQPTRGKVR